MAESGEIGSHTRRFGPSVSRAGASHAVFPAAGRGLLSIALVALLAGRSAPAGTDPSSLLICTELNYPPYSFRDENGQPAGFNVDLTKSILRVMGMQAEIRIGAWSEIRKALETGEIDVIGGMYYSAEREEKVDFSPPFAIVHHAVFAHRDASPVESAADLKGRELVVMRGDIMHDYVLAKGLTDRLILADTPAEALRLLAAGKHEYALLAKLPGLHWMKTLKLSNVTAIGKPIRPEKYCYAVVEGNEDLLAAFSEGLAILEQTGQYQDIYARWLGVLEPRRSYRSELLRYVALPIGFLVLLLAGTYGWSRWLRRAVTQRTRALEREVTERQTAEETLRLDESRLEALLALNNMTEAPMQEITDFALEEGVKLTGSRMGYLAFLNDDETVLTMLSWSKNAVEEGATKDKPLVYPVEKTGWWGEAGRQRKPIITNDCSAYESTAKSEGDDSVLDFPLDGVTRHLNVPVFEGDRIVAVAGAVNKEEDYDEADVRQLTLLMQGMWRLIQRKLVQDELAQHREHLEHLVEARTEELTGANKQLAQEVAERKRAEHQLQQAVEELERSNTELQQFAYVASHDLQEPLRAVTGYCQLVARRYAGKLDKNADQFFGYITDGVDRMKALINGLLAYSRVSTKGKPFELTDLNEVLSEALCNLDSAIVETGAQITHDPLPPVRADGAQIARVFQNLIGNALKFRGEQIPRIHVSAEPAKQAGTDGSLAQPGSDGWVFAVRDNGIGLDPQYADRIFVIFQRLHTRNDYPGTGIGLAVCRRIVERHGGRIWVESQAKQGAVFYFTIPGNGGNES